MIRKIIFNTLFIVGGIFFIFTYSFSVDKKGIVDLREYLQRKSDFTPEEIDILIPVLEKAYHEELPVDFLINRVKEGVARRVKFEMVFNVVKDKKEDLGLAKRIVEKYLIEKGKIKNRNYSIKVFSELIACGLTEEDWEDLSEIVYSKTPTIEDVITAGNILLRFMEAGVSEEDSKYIISRAIDKKMKMKEIKRISELTKEMKRTDISPEEFKNIIVNGINRKMGVGQMRREIVSLDEELSPDIERERQQEGIREFMEERRDE